MASRRRRRPRATPYLSIPEPTPSLHRKRTVSIASKILDNNASLIDYLFILSLVFGGCCTNVWSFEILLNQGQRAGSALTFSQMLFITLQSLPSFITWTRPGGQQESAWASRFPSLKTRQVPVQQWVLQVCVLTSGSLLNNWALEYRVPLSLQIVFRASGLPVSLALGYLVLDRKYSTGQIASVLLVTAGVILATLSRSTSGENDNGASYDQYYRGIAMLTASLLLTGILGLLQEKTYQRYGPCWKEGVFYTHLLSLPAFLLLVPDVINGLRAFTNSNSKVYGIPWALFILPLNLMTQLICVTGVNQLTSRVSSVTTNLVLTTRKALSLCLSVLLFGHKWNAGLGTGAAMVFFGSLWYTSLSTKR